MMAVDWNKVLSKRSGVTGIAIWMLKELGSVGTWQAVVAMSLATGLAAMYMILDHRKQSWKCSVL